MSYLTASCAVKCSTSSAPAGRRSHNGIMPVSHNGIVQTGFCRQQ